MENIHAYVLLYNNEVFLTLKAWDAVADGIVLLSDQPEVEAEFETFFSANLRREARGHLVLAEVDSSDVDRNSGRNLSPFVSVFREDQGGPFALVRDLRLVGGSTQTSPIAYVVTSKREADDLWAKGLDGGSVSQSDLDAVAGVLKEVWLSITFGNEGEAGEVGDAAENYGRGAENGP